MSIDFSRHVHALKSATWRCLCPDSGQSWNFDAGMPTCLSIVQSARRLPCSSSPRSTTSGLTVVDFFVLVAMSSSLLRLHPQSLARSSSFRPTSSQRVRYSTQGPEPAKSSRSPHAQFYSDLVPGMVPVALLGSAIYLVSDCLLHVLMCISFCSSRA